MRIRSDKDLRAPFVKTRSEESVPRPAGDDDSTHLLHEENHKDYNQFVYLVKKQLRPTNIL